jgi:hypothetical protein
MRWIVFLCSPYRLLAATVHCSGTRLSATPLKPALRSGLSLARSGCPFPDHLCEVTVSGLPLQRHGRLSQARSIPDSAPCARCRAAGGFIARDPLPAPCAGRTRRILRPLLPFGTFRPAGSSLGPVHLRKAYLEKRPVSFAPRQLKFLFSTLPDQRSGSVSFPRLAVPQRTTFRFEWSFFSNTLKLSIRYPCGTPSRTEYFRQQITESLSRSQIVVRPGLFNLESPEDSLLTSSAYFQPLEEFLPPGRN